MAGESPVMEPREAERDHLGRAHKSWLETTMKKKLIIAVLLWALPLLAQSNDGELRLKIDPLRRMICR
jgi:hypothetical protein